MTSQINPVDIAAVASVTTNRRTANQGGVSLNTCSMRSCKGPSSEKVRCGSTTCDREVHLVCFEHFAKTHSLATLTGPPNDTTYYACTKKCYTKVQKMLNAITTTATQQTTRVSWEKDGKNGPDDPQTSMKFLMEWLMTEGNYAKFRGDGTNRGQQRKNDLCKDLAKKINDTGVRQERTARSVFDKIAYIEQQFRSAEDFAERETGQGLQENDPGAFKDAILKKCKYYFDLKDVMGDRAAAKAKITNEDLDNNTDDEVVEAMDYTASEGDKESGDDAEDNDMPTNVDIANNSSSSDNDSLDNVNDGGGKQPAGAIAGSKPGAKAVSSKPLSIVPAKRKHSRKKSRTGSVSPLGFSVDHGDYLAASAKRREAAHNETVRHNARVHSETMRHNQRIEELQASKDVWVNKQEELKYKTSLLTQYQQFVESKVPYDQIAALFPDMIALMPVDVRKLLPTSMVDNAVETHEHTSDEE